MDWHNFIVVGENIHCTRIVKRNGKKATTLSDGTEAVPFNLGGEERYLRVPKEWEAFSPAFSQGKIKHAALGLHQSMHGDTEAARDGRDYLRSLAERQTKAGAAFLDVNVDEYSNKPEEVAEAMTFLVQFLGETTDTPLSIDSSNPDTLRKGLEQCRSDIRPPMINSVSLERTEAAALVKEYNADVIVSAAGREGMPANVDERMANFREIIAVLEKEGVPRERLHLDPLVLPVSTDPMNGATFLDATQQAGSEFEGVHLNGGLSNISFGMPKRQLLNMVFAYLCAEAGTDGGIIDPVSTPLDKIATLNPADRSFQLAKAVLTGEDMFGMEYISAYREGTL
ncbi:MAG: dihydropteroate synthase [Candidatus Pacebacteria bacterium]|nr:dihydropteroate synthase [Candidatus Paceibacterota bacterium]